jgi:AraC-like DNA-binding protein
VNYPESEKHREAYKLFVEQGERNLRRIAEHCEISISTVRRVLKTTKALAEYQRRVDHAQRMFHDEGLRVEKDICSRSGISPLVFRKEVILQLPELPCMQRRDTVPVLHSAGELLRQAGEQLLRDISESGYNDENVKQWMALANAYERFRTGEYRIEMILVGIEDFASYFRINAKERGITPDHISVLISLLDEYRRDKVQQLQRQQAHAEKVSP